MAEEQKHSEESENSLENLLKRQFRADRPNTKWVTDISYIHTKVGVLYLSMIRDLYDNNILSYKMATHKKDMDVSK